EIVSPWGFVRMRFMVFVVFAALVFSVSAQADEPARFVFDRTSVKSTMSTDFHIALGDRYSAAFIKSRFRPFAVEFSDECEIECFVVSRDGAYLSIYGSEEAG